MLALAGHALHQHQVPGSADHGGLPSDCLHGCCCHQRALVSLCGELQGLNAACGDWLSRDRLETSGRAALAECAACRTLAQLKLGYADAMVASLGANGLGQLAPGLVAQRPCLALNFVSARGPPC